MEAESEVMSAKRARLSASKVKERVSSLEERIAVRKQKLDQLNSRVERTGGQDERLLSARDRLDRRLEQEVEQLQKLQRLLDRLATKSEETGVEDADTQEGWVKPGAVSENVEAEVSEEFDDLHRSFEEVKACVTEMQARFSSVELPRDLPHRLNSFEERISQREEVDSDLFRQVLSLQSSLEQERILVRRFTKRLKEHEDSLEALREAAEESVVATVDLTEKLEELEEQWSELSEHGHLEPGTALEKETISDLVQEEIGRLQEQVSLLATEINELKRIREVSPSLEESFAARLFELESLLRQTDAVADEGFLPLEPRQLATFAAVGTRSRPQAKFGRCSSTRR